jgi:peptidyl-tRNA hydrolase, PTH1 family
MIYTESNMKVIIGLGNPEKKYANTRHNTGVMAVEWLAAQHQALWQAKSKLQAEQTQLELNGVPVLLIKPSLNYNNNGLVIRKVKDFYSIDNKDILVIHDELVLPFGTVRVRLKGSDAGNNGIKDVNSHIGEEYARVRIGIGSQDKKQGDIDYVLSNFTRNESALLPEIYLIIERILRDFTVGTLEPTSCTIEEIKK